MLILARGRYETVMIETPEGRKIEVVVTAISGGKVRLGFAADRDVKIWRTELRDGEPRPDRHGEVHDPDPYIDRIEDRHGE